MYTFTFFFFFLIIDWRHLLKIEIISTTLSGQRRELKWRAAKEDGVEDAGGKNKTIKGIYGAGVKGTGGEEGGGWCKKSGQNEGGREFAD